MSKRSSREDQAMGSVASNGADQLASADSLGRPTAHVPQKKLLVGPGTASARTIMPTAAIYSYNNI